MKPRTSNKELNLSIDDNSDKLKIMYSVLVNKSENDLAETRSFWVKVGKELLLPLNDDESTINICKNLWRGIKSAYDRTHKKRKNDDYICHTINDIEEGEEEKKHDDQLDLPTFQPAPKNRSYKSYVNLSTRRKKERVAEIKKLIIKIANPTSSEPYEYFDECNHVIEDTVDALRKSLKIVKKPLDSNSVECGANDIVIDKKNINKDLSNYFNFELSNKKYAKARKLLQNSNVQLMSRHALVNQKNDVNFIGFKIKWIENKKDKNDVPFEEEEEVNYGARMDFTDAIKTYIERDKVEHNITYNSDNPVYIVNSCDSAVHPVTKYCDCTILT